MKRSGVVLAAAALLLAAAAPAWAKVVYVSGRGRDSNSCSRSAPCRQLQRGVTAAGSGGEVIVLDSASLRPVTIGDSVTISTAPGVRPVLTASSPAQAGVTILGPAIKVAVRGLAIEANPAAPSNYGILVQDAGEVEVENCSISGFPWQGIWFNAPGKLTVLDSVVRNNGRGGIVLGVNGAGGRASGVINRVRVTGNGSAIGASYDAGIAAIAGSDVTVANSLAADNFRGISSGGSDGQDAGSKVVAENCVLTRNVVGLFAKTTQAGSPTGASTLSVSHSNITGNTLFAIETQGAGSVVNSFGDNTVHDNGGAETFGATLPKK